MSAEHELGPLPQPKQSSYVTDCVMRSIGVFSYTEDQMRAYALAEVHKALSQQAQEIERLKAQRVPLTEDQIIAANYPDGEENEPTIAAPDFELLAFGRQIEAAVLANHPLQRLADLSKEIGEKL